MNLPAHEPLHPAESVPDKHQLPPLAYEHTALEPCIDSGTMILHHDIHHGGYVEKLNAALEKFPRFRDSSVMWLLRNLDKVPKEIRSDIHHNAGGHFNHSMFWRAMKPSVDGEPAPEPKGGLREAIIRDFGSFDEFKQRFEEAGNALFGSGWVWLVRTRQEGGKLGVVTTFGHDNPMMQDQFPLLLNDVWEHAYYLQYKDRRLNYLKAWWSIVDWDEAARRFDLSDNSAEEIWEEEGGHQLEVE